MSINTIASQKLGIEAAVSEAMVEILSNIEYCFIAEYIPIGIPIASAKSMLVIERYRVLGKVCAISWTTGIFDRMSFPKFPCMSKLR